MEIIVGRQGNQKVPITDATVSRQHCKLTEMADGTFMLENLSKNGTSVNGQSIIRTHVTRDTVLQLSPTFSIKVADLVGAQPSAHEPSRYSIAPLQRAWDKYQNTLEEIRRKQKSIQNLRMIAPIFTMASGALSFAIPGAGIPLLVIGIGLTIYAFIKSNNDASDELRKQASEKFQEEYLCPNPKCQHTLPLQSPKLLLHNKSCPYCGCKFAE